MILCGGAGTRLWPVSRQAFSKHLLRLTGKDSLLQQTLKRASGSQFAPAIVISGDEQRPFIKRELEAVGSAIESILLEPEGRNTSAAAALAAVWLTRHANDEMLLLMPSDHVIGDREAFLAAIETAAPHAQNGAIVTFGAQPTGPNTQYGYIEAGDDLGRGAFRIGRFHEKPGAEKAAAYVASGRFFWNAGIFLMKASTLLGEIQKFLPASLEAITRSLADATKDGLFVRPSAQAFMQAENISIDHGIMEKTDRGVVVPVQMNWSDVGTWDAVWNLGSKDTDNNVTLGDVVALDTTNSLLRSDGGVLVAAIGLEGMAVIAVADAVLVAPLDRVAELKPLIEQLKAEHGHLLVSPSKTIEHE